MERQRFAFPPSWLYVDNIEGEWGAFNDILKRKDSSIQTQVHFKIKIMYIGDVSWICYFFHCLVISKLFNHVLMFCFR